MRFRVCLILAGACALGFYAWRQGTRVPPQVTPPSNAAPASLPVDQPAKPSTTQAPPTENGPSATPAIPRDCSVLEFGGGVQILWCQGAQELTGRLNGQETWSLETDFPVADARSGMAKGEVLLSAVDGLSSLRLDARTGKIVKAERLGGAPAAEAPVAEVDALLKQARATYTSALRQLRANDKNASREGARALLESADHLSKLGRQTEAFKVWAVAKKLQKTLDPVPVPTPLRPTPKPPPDSEDLDF